MSVVHADQTWESNDTPFVLVSTMARSTTNAIEGTDLRGGDGTAKDGYAFYAPSSLIPGSKPRHNPGYFFVIDYFLRFKLVTLPSGGDIDLFAANGNDIPKLRIRAGGGVANLRSTINLTSATGTASLGTTAHDLRMLCTFDFGLAGVSLPVHARIQCFLDGSGTADIDSRVSVGNDIEFSTLQVGVNASAKVTWECIFGRMKLITGVDPE